MNFRLIIFFFKLCEIRFTFTSRFLKGQQFLVSTLRHHRIVGG